MSRRLLPMVLARLSLAACATAAVAPSLGAQTDITIELGASRIGPPLGLDSESARFAVGGLRASHYVNSVSGVFASALAGRTLGDSNGGDFVTATLGGSLGEQWSAHVGGSFELEFVTFGVRAPFPYSAFAVEGRPTLHFDAGPVSLEVAGVLGTGHSRLEVWRVVGGRTRVFENALARAGATAELLFGRGPVRVGLAGGTHGTPGGTFNSGGARLLVGGGWGAFELRGDVWRTPLGTESTAGLALLIPMSGWSVRGFFGRSEPDPLTLAEPGSTSLGVLLGRSLYARSVGGTTAGSVPYEVLAPTATGARVRIAVEAPEGARSVSLLGDFTLWEERAMERRGGRWEVEVEVPAGSHHYGFLVDDEWYVPDDTRDVVPDEWGRVSAILVIEGVE